MHENPASKIHAWFCRRHESWWGLSTITVTTLTFVWGQHHSCKIITYNSPALNMLIDYIIVISLYSSDHMLLQHIKFKLHNNQRVFSESFDQWNREGYFIDLTNIIFCQLKYYIYSSQFLYLYSIQYFEVNATHCKYKLHAAHIAFT